jgi:DNA repair protein RecO (recombination protein O)
MSETILNGYLISKNDFQVFDEIITFITPNNEKISCISLGSKKIESKNGRNLFLGNLNEFQIFRSRSSDKLSKLKKTISIEQIDFSLQNNACFILLNECINLTPPNTNSLFDFYKSNLNRIKENKYSSHELILIILMKYIKLLGINLEVNCCVVCGSKKIKTISFNKHGMLCPICITNKDKIYDLKISKLIHFLFNEKFDELNKYKEYFLLTIDLLKIFIQDNSGIFLKTNI